MYAVEFEADVTNTYNLLQNFEQFMNQHIKVIVLAQEKPSVPQDKARYDFSDLQGKLGWSGDALAQQRSLRDEW